MMMGNISNKAVVKEGGLSHLGGFLSGWSHMGRFLIKMVLL